MPRRPFRAISGTRWKERATLIQETQGIRDAGVWNPGLPFETAIWVITAPASAGLARSVLPEGARITDARQFWLDEPVRPVRVGTEQTGPDVILYQTFLYQVRHVSEYLQDGFVECLATRKDGQGDQSPHD